MLFNVVEDILGVVDEVDVVLLIDGMIVAVEVFLVVNKMTSMS